MASAATGETGLIERLAARLGPPPAGVRVGIGDDAAVLAPDLVWSSDLLVEDVHFRRSTTSPEDVGWKALAVNVSDLAAMGAEPLAALVGLGVAPGWSAEDLEAVYDGLAACAAAGGCPVVGGDVSRAPTLVVAVTVLGRSDAPVTRAGARPGDALVVTGALGGSEAGRLLLEGALAVPPGVDVGHLARRHRRPSPRAAAARVLAPVAHALLDVSDGLASDARRLAERSGVTVVLDLDALPLDEGVGAVAARLGREPGAFAAAGGEDYELLAAVDPAAVPALADLVTVVGRVEAGPAALRLVGAGAVEGLAGWDHLAAPGWGS